MDQNKIFEDLKNWILQLPGVTQALTISEEQNSKLKGSSSCTTTDPPSSTYAYQRTTKQQR
jgi:hypothetical protein